MLMISLLWQRHPLVPFTIMNCCFQRAVKACIWFNPTKYTSFAQEIQVLGHTINQKGGKPKSKGIEAIAGIEPSSKTSALKRFLGLCKFFPDYIPNTPSRSQHLRQLLKKDSPFQWTPSHTKEFEELKPNLTSPAFMLYHPDWNSPFELCVDAKKINCSAMLVQ